MPDKFEPGPQRGHRGPYVYLNPDEMDELLRELGKGPLNRTLGGLRDRILNATDPVYANMKKPL